MGFVFKSSNLPNLADTGSINKKSLVDLVDDSEIPGRPTTGWDVFT